ncbi:DegT/DnrJ/EryC1/StrS family aminotransferase [Zavarzinella formosa]|uniref:DegT/DnrJ/EryC1/StrS family aminotransferase n=1 Tax=Zavarzinella formosa TaxID=360055 RepID=UPI0003189843|nr:DegT/DnrJ/EryC1/StrS family aminotransferase [Zavarzinella formosa]
MKVPFLDLPAQNRSVAGEIRAAMDEVIDASAFILGPAVERFERNFAKFAGTSHCVGLNNGTTSLQMALIAAGVGPGDEVIITPLTWVSTAWAISYVGATPVFADVDPVSYTLDPELVRKAITPKTKAIMPVHIYGQMADMTALMAIATEHKLVVIEDAAQAHGATQNGRSAGSIGHIGSFSFYPGKNLGAFGEGGAIVTNDESIAKRIARLRDHAQQGRHNHVEIGFNTRMEGLQGAVLDVKLRHLPAWNDARRRHARFYERQLGSISELQLPRVAEGHDPVWHVYCVQLKTGSRDVLRDALAEKGIATGVHYPTPVPYQPAYAYLGHRVGDFPVAEGIMNSCFSLPMYAELTAEQLTAVCDSLKELLPMTKRHAA